MACSCCRSAVRESLRGAALCTSLGGLAAVLFGAKCLAPLGPPALQSLSLSWFSATLCTFGAVLALLGLAAGIGFSAPMHCLTGACLVLLPLECLLVWAYTAYPTQLRWLAARDQTYALTSILEWVSSHQQVAAGLAGTWLLLQAFTVLLGLLHGCFPPVGRRHRHPWDRYWTGEDGGREPLLPRARMLGDGSGGSGSPRGAGYHTPPSRFQSPYSSPARMLAPSGPLSSHGAPTAPPISVS